MNFKFNYLKPKSLKEALDLKARNPDAHYVAGATDIFVKIKNRKIFPSTLISLRGIEEINGIREDKDFVYIGALCTISEIISNQVIKEKYPVLVDALRQIGSVQIRNVATLGGNLCNASPCADSAPPLIILEGKVRIASASGEREVEVEEFFKGPGETCLNGGEILTEIKLPPVSSRFKSVFFKKGRVKMDLAIASLAAGIEMDGNLCCRAKISAGSVAPFPVRLKEVEKILEGKEITGELIEEVAQLGMKLVAPITDIRATEEYRRVIIGVFLKRALKKLSGVGGE